MHSASAKGKAKAKDWFESGVFTESMLGVRGASAYVRSEKAREGTNG
jgi:hypothetical protein